MIWTLSLAAKSTLVLGAATVAAWALRRFSASTRHALWSLTLLCLLALPLLSWALPSLRLPLLPAPTTGAVRHQETFTAALEGTRVPFSFVASLPSGLSWRDATLLAWLAGAGLGLIQLASGSFFIARAARRARPAEASGWNALLDEATASLGVRRKVELRVSPAVDVPNVWGYWSPGRATRAAPKARESRRQRRPLKPWSSTAPPPANERAARTGRESWTVLVGPQVDQSWGDRRPGGPRAKPPSVLYAGLQSQSR